jgi:hypothetical protein
MVCSISVSVKRRAVIAMMAMMAMMAMSACELSRSGPFCPEFSLFLPIPKSGPSPSGKRRKSQSSNRAASARRQRSEQQLPEFIAPIFLLDMPIRFSMGRICENTAYIFVQSDNHRRERRDSFAAAIGRANGSS